MHSIIALFALSSLLLSGLATCMCSRSSVKYELTYFDARGLGELSRLLLTVANVSFTDTRIPSNSSVWAELKPRTIFGKLPFLRVSVEAEEECGGGDVSEVELNVNGEESSYSPCSSLSSSVSSSSFEIAQSRAIERYLARSFHLYGRTLTDAAFIDAIVDQLADIRLEIGAAKSDEQKQTLFQLLPTHFSNLNKVASRDSSPYFVGLSKSWADVAFFNFVNSASLSANPDMQRVAAEFFDKQNQYPALSAVYNVVAANSLIVDYVAKRKPTPF